MANDTLPARGSPANASMSSRRNVLHALVAAPILASSSISSAAAGVRNGEDTMNMHGAILPDDRRTKLWIAAWTAHHHAQRIRDCFHAEVLEPIERQLPNHPLLGRTFRVGTHHKTGQPLMTRFMAAEVESDDPDNVYRFNKGWQEARKAWFSYKEEMAVFEARTDYSSLSDRGDALCDAAYDAQLDLLCCSAPDMCALGHKVEIALSDDGPGFDTEDVKTAILADIRRLRNSSCV